MSKCAFCTCKEEATGSKQFNSIVERIYLCTNHLIKVAQLDSFSVDDAMKFIEMLKKSIEEEELKKVNGVLKLD
jgi:tRNA splicing endonuclease